MWCEQGHFIGSWFVQKQLLPVSYTHLIYKDREAFASQVQTVIATDLLEMGLEIKNLNIRDIKDDNGYLDALGAGRIAEVKKEAEIATANAIKETQISVSESKKLGEAAKLKAETEIAEAQKKKDVQQSEYRREQDLSLIHI